jgi:hypothetical protein
MGQCVKVYCVGAHGSFGKLHISWPRTHANKPYSGPDLLEFRLHMQRY